MGLDLDLGGQGRPEEAQGLANHEGRVSHCTLIASLSERNGACGPCEALPLIV
jgi:hypothetical protein